MSIDQTSDDAEFEAFLHGEGALADGLDGLPQPSPNAALDAAILARARADMAREARPPAANDARVHGRWRLPAGLAAAVLAGVLGHQAWKNNADAERAALEPKEFAGTAPAASPAPTAPAQAVEKAAVPIEAGQPKAEQAPRAPAPVQQRASASARARASAPAPAAATRAGEDAVVEYFAPMQKQASAATAQGALQKPPPPPAPAPTSAPPAPAAASPAYTLLGRPGEFARRAPESAAAVAAPASPAPLTYGATEPSARRIEVTGSAIKRSDADAASAPAPWLKRIAALLDSGDKPGALAEWRAFRAAYPDYAVDAPLAAAIKAAQE